MWRKISSAFWSFYKQNTGPQTYAGNKKIYQKAKKSVSVKNWIVRVRVSCCCRYNWCTLLDALDLTKLWSSTTEDANESKDSPLPREESVSNSRLLKLLLSSTLRVDSRFVLKGFSSSSSAISTKQKWTFSMKAAKKVNKTITVGSVLLSEMKIWSPLAN